MNSSFFYNNNNNSSENEFSTIEITQFINSTSPFQRGERRANIEAAKYIAIAITTASVYTLLVLLVHSCKSDSFRRKSFSTMLCLLAAFCSLLVSLNKLSELWIGVISCSTYHQTATVVYSIGLALIYTTLWTRQRRLYSDDLLAATVSKLSRIVSAVVIIVIYLLMFFVFASFITVLKFEKAHPPCHVVWYPLSSLLPLVVFFITTCFILQLVLFLLLVNPLRRGSSICGDVLCTRSKNDIHAMLKRLAVCACLCIVSTILLSIAILLDSVEIICIYWGNLVALDILINTLSTSCTFADWNRRILPMFTCLNNRPSSVMRNSVVMEEMASDKILKRSLGSVESRLMLGNGIEMVKDSCM